MTLLAALAGTSRRVGETSSRLASIDAIVRMPERAGCSDAAAMFNAPRAVAAPREFFSAHQPAIIVVERSTLTTVKLP